ncbi:MAG: NADH-quinone oxidoreductase subunit J [Parachlamydiaceae bacterium]|nr:NADH-quinone oxidoreductase subunit J [Parachlamydiaceae bacterium]
MLPSATTAQWILGMILVLSSLGVIMVRKPVHACLSFLLTLLSLATLYLQLSAEFIAVIQILVYAGAILVIFMFVIILFQDAHQKIEEEEPKSSKVLLSLAGIAFILSFGLLARQLMGLVSMNEKLPADYGTVQAIGKSLYIDFFFPFEAIVMVFLVAIVGALYIGKKSDAIQIEED